MIDKTRRILLIIGLSVMVVGVAILIYIFFFKSLTPAVVPADQGTAAVNGGLPAVGLAGERTASQVEADRLQGIVRNPAAGQSAPTLVADGGLTTVQPVTNQIVFEPYLNSSGQLVYYDKQTNYFYKQTSSGPQKLSNQAFYGATQVTWDQNGDKAVIYYPDNNKIVYDFTNQKQYSVPKEFSEIEFTRDGSQLAAKQITKDPSQNLLVVFSPDGKIMHGVENLGDKGDRVTVNWSPNNQVVAFLQENRGSAGTEIFPLGQNQENFASVKVPGFGFKAQWSPQADTFLFSSSKADDGFRPRLYLGRGSADYLGSIQTDLDLQTSVDKCAFNAAGTKAYCAVPQNLPAVSGPFPELAQNLQNDFYQIDLDTGRVSLLGEPFLTVEGSQSTVDVERVFVSPDGGSLYFTNRGDGKVYQMRLR